MHSDGRELRTPRKKTLCGEQSQIVDLGKWGGEIFSGRRDKKEQGRRSFIGNLGGFVITKNAEIQEGRREEAQNFGRKGPVKRKGEKGGGLGVSPKFLSPRFQRKVRQGRKKGRVSIVATVKDPCPF